MRITIYGVGYVGLVTGACLADRGHEVLCVDIDASKISQLQNGGIPIYEPGLDVIVRRCSAEGRLQFTTDTRMGAAYAKLQMIAVGTPPDANGAPNLTFILNVARAIGRNMTSDCVIINKSTVPVGTAEKVEETARQALAARGLDLQVEVVSNPEFLKEGSAIKDFMEPDRIIIGASSQQACKLMKELYAPILTCAGDMLIMDRRSAEFCKYAANAMLATRISFMNEMSNLAEKLGVDIDFARQGVGRDKRIGPQFLNAGCGYGGSCFPKDIQGIQHMARQNDCALPLLDAVSEVNHRQRGILFEKLVHRFGNLAGKTFAVWGLTFKANTDDIRNSPAIDLVEKLLSAGARVQGYDPEGGPSAAYALRHHTQFKTMETTNDCLQNASALVICTEWQEFRDADFSMVAKLLLNPVIIDGRNLFDPDEMSEQGFEYSGIGRGVSRYYQVAPHDIIDRENAMQLNSMTG